MAGPADVAMFADPRLGAVAPRVRPGPATAPVPTLGAGAVHRGPLGPRHGARAERGGTGPAGRLRAHRGAGGPRSPRSSGGFDDGLRVGEDVDLVWRLLEAGWRVRYEPSVTVRHASRRRGPGCSAAGSATAPRPGLSPAAIPVAWPRSSSARGRPRWRRPSSPATRPSAAGPAGRLRRGHGPPAATPRRARRPLALRWSALGAGWTVVGVGRALTMLAGPAVVVGAVRSRTVGRDRRPAGGAAPAGRLVAAPPAARSGPVVAGLRRRRHGLRRRGLAGLPRGPDPRAPAPHRPPRSGPGPTDRRWRPGGGAVDRGPGDVTMQTIDRPTGRVHDPADPDRRCGGSLPWTPTEPRAPQPVPPRTPPRRAAAHRTLTGPAPVGTGVLEPVRTGRRADPVRHGSGATDTAPPAGACGPPRWTLASPGRTPTCPPRVGPGRSVAPRCRLLPPAVVLLVALAVSAWPFDAQAQLHRTDDRADHGPGPAAPDPRPGPPGRGRRWPRSPPSPTRPAGTLATETSQLAAAQAQLASTEANVFANGVSINDLDTCLSGVEQALNQISLGRPGGCRGPPSTGWPRRAGPPSPRRDGPTADRPGRRRPSPQRPGDAAGAGDATGPPSCVLAALVVAVIGYDTRRGVGPAPESRPPSASTRLALQWNRATLATTDDQVAVTTADPGRPDRGPGPHGRARSARPTRASPARPEPGSSRASTSAPSTPASSGVAQAVTAISAANLPAAVGSIDAASSSCLSLDGSDQRTGLPLRLPRPVRPAGRSGTYYGFATNSAAGNIQIIESTDLTHWTTVGDALPHEPAWAAPDATWAPSVLPAGQHLRPLLLGRLHAHRRAVHLRGGGHPAPGSLRGQLDTPPHVPDRRWVARSTPPPSSTPTARPI